MLTSSEINQRIRAALADHPTLTKYYKDVFKHRGQETSRTSLVTVMPASGDVLFSVLQVIVGCLLGIKRNKNGAFNSWEQIDLPALVNHIVAATLAMKPDLSDAERQLYVDLTESWIVDLLQVDGRVKVCWHPYAFVVSLQPHR